LANHGPALKQAIFSDAIHGCKTRSYLWVTTLSLFYCDSFPFLFNRFYLQPLSDYERRYNLARGQYYSRFHGYAYDGVWLMALALNKTLKADNQLHWQQIHSHEFVNTIATVDFYGVTVRLFT